MENDSIRASGANILVDIWIDGKVRAICVSQEAIGSFLGFEKAEDMSERERCEFVRGHLPLLVTAAKARLRDGRRDADVINIEGGHLPRPDGRSADRRKSDRRRTDRRKGGPIGDRPERRRGDRRQGDRRTKPPKPAG